MAAISSHFCFCPIKFNLELISAAEFHTVNLQRLFILALIFMGCTHKAQHIVLPAPQPAYICDTINITYKQDIQPIFSSNCYSCHGTAVVADDGLNLEDTSILRQYLHNGFLGDGIYGSELYHCMLHSRYAQAMPPDYVVDSCSLNKVKHWLYIGAPM